MDTFTCRICHIEKPIDSFHKHPKTKTKHFHECKSCRYLYKKRMGFTKKARNTYREKYGFSFKFAERVGVAAPSNETHTGGERGRRGEKENRACATTHWRAPRH
jgi:rubredoxin